MKIAIFIICLCAHVHNATAAMLPQEGLLLEKGLADKIDHTLDVLAYVHYSVGSDDLDNQVAKVRSFLTQVVTLLNLSGSSKYSLHYSVDVYHKLYREPFQRVQGALCDREEIFAPVSGFVGFEVLEAIEKFSKICQLICNVKAFHDDFRKGGRCAQELFSDLQKDAQEHLKKIDALPTVTFLAEKMEAKEFEVDGQPNIILWALQYATKGVDLNLVKGSPILLGLLKSIRVACESCDRPDIKGQGKLLLDQDSLHEFQRACNALTYWHGSVGTDDFNKDVAQVACSLKGMVDVLSRGDLRYAFPDVSFDHKNFRFREKLQKALTDNRTLFEPMISIKGCEALAAAGKFCQLCDVVKEIMSFRDHLSRSLLLQGTLSHFEQEATQHIRDMEKIDAVGYLRAQLKNKESSQGGLSRAMLAILYKKSESIHLSAISGHSILIDLIKSIRAQYESSDSADMKQGKTSLVGQCYQDKIQDARDALRFCHGSIGTDALNRQIDQVREQLMRMEGLLLDKVSSYSDHNLQKALFDNQDLFAPFDATKGLEEVTAICKLSKVCEQVLEIAKFRVNYNRSPLLKEMLPQFETEVCAHISQIEGLDAIVYLKNRLKIAQPDKGALSDQAIRGLFQVSRKIRPNQAPEHSALYDLIFNIRSEALQRVLVYVKAEAMCPGLLYRWIEKEYPEAAYAEAVYIAAQKDTDSTATRYGFPKNSVFCTSLDGLLGVMQEVSFSENEKGKCSQIRAIYYLALEAMSESAKMRREDFQKSLNSIIQTVSGMKFLDINQKKDIMFMLCAPHLFYRGCMNQELTAALWGTGLEVCAPEEDSCSEEDRSFADGSLSKYLELQWMESSSVKKAPNFLVDNAVNVLLKLHCWELQGACFAQVINCAAYINGASDKGFSWNQVIFDVLCALSREKTEQSLKVTTESFLIKMKAIIKEHCKKNTSFWKEKTQGQVLTQDQKLAIKRYIM